MTSQPYPLQIDCVWIASDRNDRVAAFVTAGCGPVAKLALEHPFAEVEEIEAALLLLPKTSDFRLGANLGRTDSFERLAERGFFVHDWSDVNETNANATHAYTLVAFPLNPISSSKLPEGLRSCANTVNFPTVNFEDAPHLDATALLECVAGN
jgi:hypothetical protein